MKVETPRSRYHHRNLPIPKFETSQKLKQPSDDPHFHLVVVIGRWWLFSLVFRTKAANL